MGYRVTPDQSILKTCRDIHPGILTKAPKAPHLTDIHMGYRVSGILTKAPKNSSFAFSVRKQHRSTKKSIYPSSLSPV